MTQTINTNVASLTAQRNLTSNQSSMQTTMERLSSGMRVNSAIDDAAGFAIAERMAGQSRGMSVAIRNANDAISLSQVAEGGMNEIGNMLQRMRELAVQSANGTNSNSDRDNLDAEFTALADGIGRVSSVTQFNGVAVIGGGANTFTFQVGANNGETLDLTTTDVSDTAIGVDALSVATAGGATAAITAIDTAIDTVTTSRASMGASQSQFSSAINNLQIGMVNQAAARSRIVDADFAVETANFTRSQILQQSGIAMVAQANASTRNVLSLLG